MLERSTFNTKHVMCFKNRLLDDYTVNHVHAIKSLTSVTPQVRPGLSVQRSDRSKLSEEVLMTRGFENWAVV